MARRFRPGQAGMEPGIFAILREIPPLVNLSRLFFDPISA